VSGSTDENKGSGWWKPILVAIGAAAAVVVAWGWLSPEPEAPPREPAEEEDAGAVAAVLVPRSDRQPPAWVKPTVVWTIALIVGVAVGSSCWVRSPRS
jgi:hypothetical protein